MEDLDTTSEPAADDHPAGERQCGRCQLMFPGDPAIPGPVRPGWWLCPPCREALIGHQSRGRF